MDCGQLLVDTLSFTDPEQFRQRLDNLKHKHRRADQHLQQLVAQNQHDLLSVLHIYDSVSQRIAATRARIGRVRHNLVQCKQLLHCKRHELKQLWQAGVEQRYMLTLLDAVEHLRQLPEAAASSMRAGLLYQAARQLADGLERFDNQQLVCLRALQETRLELDTLVSRLHGLLTDRLHAFLFGRQLEREGAACKLARSSARSSSRREPARDLVGVVGELTSTADLCQLHERLSREQLSSLESSGYGGQVGGLLLVLESLILLGKLSDTLETLYGRTNGELFLLVSRVTVEVSSGEVRGSGQLEKLVTTLGEQLLSIGDTHEQVLALLRKLAPSDGSAMLYTSQTVWQRIQETLQRVFTEYLECSASQNHDDKASVLVDSPAAIEEGELDADSADLSSYFMRKRVNRSSASQLFTFKNSSTSLDMLAYLREKSQQEGCAISTEGVAGTVASTAASRVRLPLKSHPFNIRWLYPAFVRLTSEIETRNHSDVAASTSNKACSLRVFINDYINDILLHRLRIEGQQLVERRIDNWQQLTAAGQQEGSPLPLLHSVWQVEQFVATLHQLIPVLSSHANHLLSVVCAALVQFKEAASAQLLFMSRSSAPLADGEEPGSADPGVVLAASWARDPDISRFLRELPDWQQQKQRNVERGTETVMCRTASEDVSIEQTYRRYQRETEMLAANLDDKQPPSAADMLDDERVWRQLAHFHYSVQYIAVSVGRRTAELRGSGPANVPDSSLQTMAQLGRDLHELADTALLTLYLEVRVLCLYHLQRLLADGARFVQAGESGEVDADVARLAERLEAVGAALAGAVAPVTRHYVLDGAAALAAHVLIDGAARLERVNENGVRRLVGAVTALQHALKQLTQRREPALEQAHGYFQLLLLEPEALLQQLEVAGCQFLESQYAALLKLMHASRPGLPPTSLHANLERLADIAAGHFAETV